MTARIAAGVLLLALVAPRMATAQAQSVAAYVNHVKVTAAFERGGTLLTTAQVRVAGVHSTTAAPVDTEHGTTVMYVIDGAATLVSGGATQRISKGDAVVIPA